MLAEQQRQRDTAPSASSKRAYKIAWCPVLPGFGVRVTSGDGASWVFERRVFGKTVRRTIGPAVGRGAITDHAARKLAIQISAELQTGIDRAAERREQRRNEKAEAEQDALTLAVALGEYVKNKRRGKDGKPLKQRTRDDYVRLVQPGRVAADGKPFLDGELYHLAQTPLARITADDIRTTHANIAKRSPRMADYAMAVLRAVLRWHGVTIAGNPLGRETAGRDRIVLAPTKGAPNPIPPERVGAWWQAAGAMPEAQRATADAYRFMLLTGARSGETKGVTVRDVDLVAGRLTLRDTKNRTDHVILLSKQAQAIVERRIAGRKAGDPVFAIGDGRKTLRAINEKAGVLISPHDLRATFASIADELASAYVLKRMMNHALAGDVTGAHYVGKSESQLRAGWQAVADFLDAAAAEHVKKTT
ncbi:MAG: integrase family protein [Burkholderiaceae bacterium]|nr:integrase family protein [Burkholderiaceae bacterium]